MKEFIEKLIGRLEEESDYEPIDYDYCDMSCSDEEHFISTHKAIKIVNQLAEEYNNGWIPCSEELPPQPKSNILFENKPLELYLATVKGSDYAWRVFWNGECFTDGWSKVDVLAWQSLPEPYRQKGGAE